MKFENLSNSDLNTLINQWIRSKRNRSILRKRLIDGVTYEQLAEEFDLSVRQTKNIVYKCEDMIFRHIN